MFHTNKFMLPTNDYVFHRIFGHKGNEQITCSFINAILKTSFKRIILSDSPILEKDLKDDKIGILDIKAELKNGTICNIEMQFTPIEDMIKRMLFYWSKLFYSQIQEGDDYHRLHRTICILIVDYEINVLKDINKYHSKWKIKEDEYSQIVLTDAFEFHIIDLVKFTQMLKNNQIRKNDKLAIWLKFFKNPKNLEESEMSKNKMVKNALNELTKLEQDEHERWLAEQRLIYIRDMHSTELYGYNRGKAEEKKQIIINLYKENASIDFICKVTKLSKNKVHKILDEYIKNESTYNM